MREVNIKIPDQQYEFFMELVSRLGLEAEQAELSIPEEHKKIVLDRTLKSQEDPNRLLNWDDVKNNFKFS